MTREERRDERRDDDLDETWGDDEGGRGPREGEDPREAVVERRREVEERLAEVRAAIGREVGVAPAARYTLLALVAGAVGLSLAVKRRKRKKRATR
jgi:hypothetical protein